MKDHDYTEHLEKIREIVRQRLAELGIEDRLPDLGIFRIIHEEAMDYWQDAEDTEHNLDLSDAKLCVVETSEPVDGLDIEAEGPEGERIPVAFIARGEDAMYVRGHRLSFRADGTVEAHHRDGSSCEVGCRFCEEGDIAVRKEDNEWFARCRHCGAYTAGYPSRFLAVGAWIIGKVTESAL